MAEFADHFSSSAKTYSQFRPHYPEALFNFLVEQSAGHDCAWDCATGSGQSASMLANHFEHVIASDASYQQLQNAQQSDRVSYFTCLAEQIPLADNSLDLITVAQALHWFKLESFYVEVRRILKPDGLLAVWTYNLMQINPVLDEIVWHLYNDVLGEYWPFERKLVEGGYKALEFPFRQLPVKDFTMQSDWSFAHLLGYLSTWSAVKRYREQHQLDPVDALRSDLLHAWGAGQVNKVSWPLTLKLGSL